MRKRQRQWVEPVLIGLVSLLLVGAFWFAWENHGSPAAQPTGQATGVVGPNRSATDGPDPQPTIDPTLAAQVKKLQQKRADKLLSLSSRAQAVSKQLSSVSEFKMVDFNALAASMNSPGRPNHNWPTAVPRTDGLWQLLQTHQADVATFQEFQAPQRARLLQLMGGQYGIYPATEDRLMPRAIIWRTDRFELVSGETLSNPWFFGGPRHTPRVLLRDKVSGVEFYVATYHNPPDTMGNQSRWRHGDMYSQINSTNQLITSQKKPIIVTGDMNDKQLAFCAWTGNSSMHAAAGGSNDGTCRPPPPRAVDWVFGSPEVTFSNYQLDPTSRARRISDHEMVVVDVRISNDGSTG